MDSTKVGKLIMRFRKEKGLTQQNIADALGITNKTVSKWECGLGCPDLAIWPELSIILGVDMQQMMEGELTVNKPDNGNINKIRFYVCPICGNILFSTGSASIVCCGRNLKHLCPEKGIVTPKLSIEEADTDYFISIDHPMSKEHYLSFAAYVKSDRILLFRLYPEQSAELRLPHIRGGKLYLYCVTHGLMTCPEKF